MAHADPSSYEEGLDRGSTSVYPTRQDTGSAVLA